jgi:hypothetical protein
LKTKLIYGAVALIGLFVMIAVVRMGDNNSDTNASKSTEAQPDAAARSAKWTLTSGSRKGQTVDWSTATESERRARQTDLEQSAASRVRRMQGGAGGEAPRYKTDPQGIGYAIIGVKPALRACYEELGKFDPKLLPKDLHVRVTIASDPNDPTRGIVTQAATVENEFQHPTVETCLQKAVSSLRFEPPAQPILANLPMEFAQRN